MGRVEILTRSSRCQGSVPQDVGDPTVDPGNALSWLGPRQLAGAGWGPEDVRCLVSSSSGVPAMGEEMDILHLPTMIPSPRIPKLGPTRPLQPGILGICRLGLGYFPTIHSRSWTVLPSRGHFWNSRSSLLSHSLVPLGKEEPWLQTPDSLQ